MRKGEELKAPRHANAAVSCDDHVTIYDIIPNRILIRKINLLKIYWPHYANKKAIKYAINLNKLGSYSAVINLNIQLLTA